MSFKFLKSTFCFVYDPSASCNKGNRLAFGGSAIRIFKVLHHVHGDDGDGGTSLQLYTMLCSETKIHFLLKG